MSQSIARARRLGTFALAALIAAAPAAAQTAHPAGKVPISTASADARADYIKGRTLQENLRAHDSREFLLRAIGKDPNFALAHLNLANSAPTAKEFFDHLGHAVALAPKASSGERLMILGAQAGANAEPVKQFEHYRQLVAEFPDDERAHFLLGGYHFGQQEYEKAIGEYRRATEISPEFAPAYNIVGYALRTAGRYGEAEEAFKKYVELIPDDPNPYDSYAELLMKTGRFDESIAQYRKALGVDSHFAPSFVGISTDLMFQNKYDESRAEAMKLHTNARNDGEKRAALFAVTVTYADEGKYDKALAELDKQFSLGKGINDAAAMAGDATFMGNVLLESGKPAEAAKKYQQAFEITQGSNLSAEVKENAKVIRRFNTARVAIASKDLATAKREGEAFMQETQARQNAFQVRLAHEVAGLIALEEKNYDGALTHLAQANQQDPYNLYRQGLAYGGKGDQAKAKEMFRKAAEFNQLPTLNSAFARAKSRKLKA